MNDQDALVVVFSRNAFYRRMHFLVLAALCLASIVIAILLVILIHIFRFPPPPLYFATDEVGRLIPVIPVDKPNMSEKEVMDWTANAITRAFSYDFINFRSQLQSSQRYFNDYGWRTYMDAVKSTNNLVALTARKMVFLAQVIGQPKLTTEGILSGSYAWKFDMPVLMTYLVPPFDAKSTFTNPLVVTVVIQREPILQSNKGLGILQVIANIAVGPGQPQQQPLTAGTPGTQP